MVDQPLVRVIVVDDHEMFLESVVRLLRDDPTIAVVGTALTAAGGAEVAAAVLPDIVILDYHLPDMEGADAIRALKSAHPDAEIITLTGSDIAGSLYASIQAGSAAWIRKTRAVGELREAVRRIAAGQEVSIEELEALPSLDELVLHYQPVVELASGRIVGFESLVRWQHPTEGLRYPGEFLPQAEATGFVVEIDRWARRQAATQLAAWQGTHGSPERLWMSVNLSATDISDPNLLDSISSVVSSTGIEPIDLVVEVTESVLLDDTQQTTDFLVKMKELGVRLALDDFGTAFSSLSYVRRFPFDLLKIDISFTAELPHSARAMLLVEAIHHLAWSVGMIGIAEGIEREEQAAALRSIGWGLGQGYFFSTPLPAADCKALLAAQVAAQVADSVVERDSASP
ncbi:MAG: EAL domain-containing protein [Acidimicrobiales bacterium]|jgi:EAL domain-containing protein (putative c-di-GMP-specific phosphodiesterase class I)